MNSFLYKLYYNSQKIISIDWVTDCKRKYTSKTFNRHDDGNDVVVAVADDCVFINAENSITYKWPKQIINKTYG